jgi:hypothetical protein
MHSVAPPRKRHVLKANNCKRARPRQTVGDLLAYPGPPPTPVSATAKDSVHQA